MTIPFVRVLPGSDGAEVAFCTIGQGPAVLLLTGWLTHLDHLRDSVAWGPWVQMLSQRYTLICHDPRGCGLSDRRAEAVGPAVWLRDAAALLEALGLDGVPVVGLGEGGALAVALAARRPDLVGRLVLWGTPLRPGRAVGMPDGWGDPDSAQVAALARRMQPDGGAARRAAWARAQALATTAAGAAVLAQAMAALDPAAEAARVACPALVMHAAGDRVVPVAQARDLARRIAGARFVVLDSANHALRADEPALAAGAAAVADFLPGPPAQDGVFARLTAREREVLDALARGGDAAAALGIGDKTLRNHVSALCRKLGFGDRVATVAAARAAGYGRPALRG